MTYSFQKQSVEVLVSSAGRRWNGLNAALVHIPGGVLSQIAGSPVHRLGMHFGPPVQADCAVGSLRMRRLQRQGDIDFVPAGSDGCWQDDADCQILRLELQASLLEGVAEELGGNGAKIELAPRLQLRDPRIEAIGWAIKADLEAHTPSDPLFIDSLANALAVRLIEAASTRSARPENTDVPKMSARQLRTLTDFIEANLHQSLYLSDLAAVVGVSTTRLKTIFRNSTGLPVHQYVLRRRIEYARALLATTTMPASQVAFAAGFAHQSHMASTMRRILGCMPSEIPRPTR